MLKKNVIAILCAAALCAGLMFGCGQIQSEGVGEAGFPELDLESSVDNVCEGLEEADDKINTGLEKIVVSRLLGTWALTVDYSAIIEEELEGELSGFHEEFDLLVCMTFNDDGTFLMYIDDESLKPALENYLESLARFSAEYTYSQLKAEGISRAQADAAAKSEFGMSIYSYILKEYTSVISVEDISGELNINGVYKAAGNRLYMDEYRVDEDVYDIFRIEGDTLTLSLPAGAVADEVGIKGLDYPYVFTRVEE